jgi:hypothetical protein
MTLEIAPEVAAKINALVEESKPVAPSDPALDYEIQKGRDAIGLLLSATRDQLSSKSFLMDCLRQFGTCSVYWPSHADYDPSLGVSAFGAIQYPSEFIDFLLFAGRDLPSTIAEIGVAHGCSSYFAAAYFYRLNAKGTYTMIDIVDTTIDFDYYSGILPLIKKMPCTSGSLIGQGFDVVFIDAAHDYRSARSDYQALGQYANTCGFHDIRSESFEPQEGGITQFWADLKQSKRENHMVFEIAHSPKKNWMGIGVIARID